MLTGEILLPLRVNPRKMNGTFSLDEADDLRNRILRRNRDQQVNRIDHQMPLFAPALLLPGKVVKHGPSIPPQLLIEDTATTLGDKNHVIFARPTGVV